MIAYPITGDSFRAVCAYLCQESKDAQVLAAEGVRTDSAQHMAEDFTFQQQLRPTLGKAVLHIALSLRPEDAEGRSPEEVSRLLKEASQAYQQELAKEIGPLKTQWLLVQHFDRNHPHAHLVMNRVDNHGKVISDSFIGEYSRRACQQVEQHLGLATAEEQGRQQARREGPTNRQIAADTPRKVRIADWQRARHTVADALLQPAAGDSGGFEELADKLAPRHIKQVVSAHQHKDGSIRYGVSYEYDGHRFKGGEVGRQFTAPKLLERFAQVQAERQSRQVDQQAEARENERVRHQAQQALTGLLDQKSFASHAAFRSQVAAQGYAFVTGPAGEAQLRHEASARQFDVAQVQPGGATAHPLWEQVEAVVLEKAAEERARQAVRREEARRETAQALTQTRDSGLSRPEQFFYRMRAQPYDLLHDPQTQQLTHVRHRGSGELFAYAEVQPGGPGAPPLAEQLATAVRAEQQQVAARQQLAAGRGWVHGREQMERVTTRVQDSQDFFNRAELQQRLQARGVTLLPPSPGQAELFRLDTTGQLFREKEVLRGGSVAQLLAGAEERRVTRRQEAWEQTKQAIAQTLHAPTTPLTSVRDYQRQLEARGYKFWNVPGQPTDIEHLASGERFSLREVRPGGPTAPDLSNQVREVLARQTQQQRHEQATKDLEQVLAAKDFRSWPQYEAQVQAKGYQFITGLDGQARLLHEESRLHFPLAELRPNGQDVARQVNDVIATRQAELVLGQIEVLSSPKRSAAERADNIKTQLEAVGVQVNVTFQPVSEAAGGIVLIYTHAVKGVQLDEINAKLTAVQRAENVAVREQDQGFGQPPAAWPARHGEYARATLVFAGEAAQHAAAPGESVRVLVQQTGAIVRERLGAAAGSLVLEVEYHTQRTDVKALTKLFDQWQHEGLGIQVQESDRARQARGGQTPEVKTPNLKTTSQYERE